MAQPARTRIAFHTEATGAPGLLRALRQDAAFPSVEITAGDAAPTTGAGPHTGQYAIVHEDGTPDLAGGVVLVEPFEVPAEDDDAFLAAWHRRHAGLAAARGHVGTRLYRAQDDAHFRFAAITRWSSPLMVARAKAPALAFPSHPALYLA